MNKPLKVAAKKLEPLSTNYNNITDLYYYYTNLFYNQSEYFRNFKPEDIIKIIIYIYSYKEVKNFDLGDQMINNLFFANFISTENENSEIECEKCEGYGVYDCAECYGKGYVRCDECSGDGEVLCEECRGRGHFGYEDCETCSGYGYTECEECDGEGSNVCNYCKGDNEIECEECDGEGYVSFENVFDYEKRYVVSWDNELKDRCEMYMNTGVGTLNFNEYNDKFMNSKLLLINLRTLPGVPNIKINPDLLYCDFFQINTKNLISKFNNKKKYLEIFTDEYNDYYFKEYN